MNQERTKHPLALGLFGLGITTVLLSLYFTAVIDQNAFSVFLATGLFAGGLFPLIAGFWAIKNEHSFDATVSLIGSMFWFSYIFIFYLQSMGLAPAIAEPALLQWVQVPFFFFWGLLAFWLFLSSMKANRIQQLYFFFLATFLWLLALGHWFVWDTWHHTGIADPSINIIAGYIGIVCGFIAIYYAMAIIMNEAFNREVMPIWKPKKRE